MGYTSSFTWLGAKAKDIIQDELPSWNILRTETKGKATYFAACRKDNPDRVVGFVALITRTKTEVCIKIMDENEGPFYNDASAKLIGLLSALPDPDDKNLWADRWRKRCLENAAKPKFKDGVLAMTLEVIPFGNGQYNTQYFKKVGTRTYGCDATGSNLVRLRFKLETSGYEWRPVKMNEMQLADMRSALSELDSKTKILCDDLVWLLKDRTDMFYADLNWRVKNLNVEQFNHAYNYVLQMLRNYGVRFFTSD